MKKKKENGLDNLYSNIIFDIEIGKSNQRYGKGRGEKVWYWRGKWRPYDRPADFRGMRPDPPKPERQRFPAPGKTLGRPKGRLNNKTLEKLGQTPKDNKEK